MNAILLRFLLFGSLLLSSLFCFAQELFPVNVSGQLIPPHSLRIGDYFTGERDNDLLFTVALNDPVEETRQVKLQLQVESNGGIVLRSDLAQAPVITLDRNFPEMFTGADLVAYFNTLNNSQGEGIPLYLTPGLNGFCLEVIDLVTDKTISNRGCALGFFNLAQPPIPQLPVCGEEIEQTATQNITFSWQPMHNASGNPINDLNYIFQLVEVPEGFQNPKDAFDAGFFIYTTDVRNMTALLYTEAEPLLEAGKKYAWRVRAQALAIDGAIVPLFDNNGYSKICTFDFVPNSVPPDPDDFSSCMGSPCNFTGELSTTPKGEAYFSGDIVKIGNFSLTFGEVSYDEGGETYSGSGAVAVNFLGTSVAVEFDNLEINKADRVFAGEATAVIEDASVVPSDFVGNFDAVTLATAGNLNVDNVEATRLATYFDENPSKLFTNLTQVGTSATTSLPIGLDVTFSAIELTHVISIVDIQFTAKSARLNALYASEGLGEDIIKFGSKGVCFRDNGLVDATPQLFLLSEVDLATTMNVPMVLEPVGTGGSGTTVEWSCDGFESFSLQGRVELSEEYVVPADPGEEKLIASFSARANSLSDFVASISIPDFNIAGLGDFTFQVGEAFFDYSSTEQLPNVNWPEGFTAPGVGWEGFYIPDISVELPVVFGDPGNALPSILGNNIIFDSTGFTGMLAGTNLLSGEDSKVGGWPFNIDRLSLTFQKNNLTGSELKGQTRLPFMDEGEWIPYVGRMMPVRDTITDLSGWNFQLGVVAEEVPIGLFRASFKFNEESNITIPYINGSFGLPRCDLSGILDFKVPDGDAGFDPEFMSLFDGLQDVLSRLGIPDLNTNMDMNGLSFKNMKFDWNSEPKFSFGSIEPVGLDLSFLGLDIDLPSVSWKQIGVTELGKPKFGFDFDIKLPQLGSLSPNIDFNIGFGWNSSASPSSGGGSMLNFDGFDMNFGLPEFSIPDFDISCAETAPDIVISGQTPLTTIDNLPTIKVGLFDLSELADLAPGSVANSFTGKAKVSIPSLGPFKDISVSLQDVVVNEAGQIIDGKVSGLFDEAFAGAEQLQGAAGNILESANEKIGQIGAAANGLFTLPIVLGVNANGEKERDQGLIITGLEFGPDGATVDAKIVIPLGDNQFAEFDARKLELVPNGIAGGELRMGLTRAFELPIPGDEALNVAPYDGEQGSYVAIDCGGFVEFNLMGVYDLPPDRFQGTEVEDTVGLAFTINTQQWGEFLGTISATEPFELIGYEGIVFKLGEGRLDFSPLRNVNEMTFPQGYNSGGSTWKGFYAPEVEVIVSADLSTGDEPLTFVAAGVLIDSLGFSGDFGAKNLVSLSEGSLGGWGASIDSFLLTVRENTPINGVMSGGLQLPIMSEEEAMPYKAIFAPAAAANTYNYNFVAKPDTVNISLLRSQFIFSEDSEITVGYNNGMFQKPVVDLSGLITFAPPTDDGGFSGEFTRLMNDISAAVPDLGDITPQFNMDGIAFRNFRFDANQARKMSIGSITPQNTSVSFLGQTADLSGINLADVDISEDDVFAGIREGARLMSFDFETTVAAEYLGLLAPTVTLSMQVTEETLPDGTPDYEFFRFNLNYETGSLDKLSTGCLNEQPELQFSDDNYAGSFAEETFDAGYFRIEEVNITADNGDGKVSGTGQMQVPVLGPMSKLRVTFNDVQLDANGRLREGEVLTESDVPEDVGTEEELSGLLANAKAKLDAVADAFALPVLLGTADYGFTVTGIVLRPEAASLQAKVIVKTGEDRYLEFVGEGLKLVPDGIAEATAKLGLGRAFTLPGLDEVLPLTLTPYDGQADKGTFVSCDCSGFRAFNLEGKAEFSRDVVLSRQIDPETNDHKTVIADFSASSEGWGTILGNLSFNDSIYIVGADELPFYLGEALIDLSDVDDHEGIEWPDLYDVPEDGKWNGVYIASASMPLPEILSDYSTGEPGFLQVQGLIADSDGFTGNFIGERLLDMETTELYGFGMAVDSFKVNFAANDMTLGRLDGRFNIPLVEAGEGVPFQSFLIPGEEFMDFYWLAKPAELSVPSLSADFEFNKKSTITIEREQGGFTAPVFDLSGSFRVASDGEGLGNEFDELVQAVNTATGTEIVPDFNLDSIVFEHFVFDPGNREKYFSVGSVTPVNSEVLFLGQTVNLDEITFGDLEDLVNTPDSVLTAAAQNEVKKLGFRFDLTVDLPVIGELPIGFTINLDELRDARDELKKVDYNFGGFRLDYELPDLSIPKFSCESPEPPEPPEDQEVAELTERTRVKVNGFTMKIEELDGDKGKGVIRIPFLNYNMNVSFDGMEVNAAGEMLNGEIVTDVEESLVPEDVADTEAPDIPVLDFSPTLEAFLGRTQEIFTLPMSLANGLEETAGLTLPDDFDIILLGIVWTKEGGKMNLALSVPSIVEGGDPLQFGLRGLNIRSNGVDLGELKIFLAETIRF